MSGAQLNQENRKTNLVLNLGFGLVRFSLVKTQESRRRVNPSRVSVMVDGGMIQIIETILILDPTNGQ